MLINGKQPLEERLLKLELLVGVTNMCFFKIAKNDALAKARGEPTRGFHNIQPNYNNPEIIAAVADKKAGRSTKFYDTGAPNIWQQQADSYAAAYKAPVKKPKQQTPKKESAPPPVLRDNISTGSSDLKINKRKDRAQKRNVTSGRRTSKAKRFSTRSK